MADNADSGNGPSGDSENSGNGGSADAMCTSEEDVKLETAPFDSRFPNQNQTKYCYVSFIDYHRCIKARGEDYEPCQYFQRVFKSICPNEWTKKWTEQIENGNFAGSNLIK